MVGLLNALPETRLYRRLTKEGRLESDTTGNNTEAALNFRPKLNREFLINGYRDLMKRLYEPRHYYQRIRIFLQHQQPRGPRLRLSRRDLEAFVKSLWLSGLAPRAPGLLAIRSDGAAPASAPVPQSHGTGHHRLSLPPCGG